MLRIKLMPFGKKHAQNFRVVVVEDRVKLTSDPAAVLGFYNPKTQESNVKKEDAQAWMKKGAQPTDTVRKLLDL
jgi:small subunit ribosomal protein S16